MSLPYPAQANGSTTRNQEVGALVIGGDHLGLAIARSLGRRKIPVVILDDQHPISYYSRFTHKVVRAKDLRDPAKTVDAVLETGHRHGLQDWVLFPTRDETVMAFALHRERLQEFFRVTTPKWETTRQAWDKTNTYKLAESLGIPAPRTWSVQSSAELPNLYPCLPLAVKPAIKENFFYATGAKAWRAETPEELHELFDTAIQKIPATEILLQEIIPGNGYCQLSYCVFFKDGRAHSSLVARRLRQHPREFGRAATYVETDELPEVEELSLRFLRAIDFYGLAEVEFKQDPRDGQFKLLDVNARAWGFHGLGQAVGVDFPYLLFADQTGRTVEPSRGRAKVGWLRLLTDAPTAAKDLLQGYLSPREYLRSLRRTKSLSVFAWDDPLPALAEMLLLPYILKRKLFPGDAAEVPAPQQ